MRYHRFPTLLLTLCACSLAASGCAPKERIQPLFPRSADVKDVITPKPVAGPEIITSAQAAADYDIAVEKWGDTIWAAGGRICRWIKDNGGVLPFDCPPGQ